MSEKENKLSGNLLEDMVSAWTIALTEQGLSKEQISKLFRRVADLLLKEEPEKSS